MTPNAASKHDKQSLHYLLLSGFAGGIAGCVVRPAALLLMLCTR